MAQEFTFMNRGVANFDDGAIYEAATADDAQSAIDLNNDKHEVKTPSRFVEDSASKHPNHRENGALFNDHRGMSTKGVTLDTVWEPQTWRSKAQKGDMHYLLEHAGLLTDEIRALKGMALPEHMVKERKERAAMRALNNGNVAAEELEAGGIDDNEDTLVDDDIGTEELKDGEIKDIDATLVEDHVEGSGSEKGAESISTHVNESKQNAEGHPTSVRKRPVMANANEAPQIQKRMHPNYRKTNSLKPQGPVGISFEEAYHMLAAIKHQALINIAYPRYDDRHVDMSELSPDIPARGVIAYKRSTHLYDDNGKVLFSYEIQDLVQEILRHRNAVRKRNSISNSAFGNEGSMVSYRNARSRLFDEVKGNVRDGEKNRVERTIQGLFGI